MQAASRIGGVLAVLALAVPAGAAPVPYVAVITQADAEVRSGPGAEASLYPTNRLQRGQRVEVVKELPGGWLEIKPPAGSFSWVNTRFIDPVMPSAPAPQTTWVV